MSVNIPELQGSFQRLYNVICTSQPSSRFCEPHAQVAYDSSLCLQILEM